MLVHFLHITSLPQVLMESPEYQTSIWMWNSSISLVNLGLTTLPKLPALDLCSSLLTLAASHDLPEKSLGLALCILDSVHDT